jgi:uracil-DNA glycosylase family 4
MKTAKTPSGSTALEGRLHDPECRDCPRLAKFLDGVRACEPTYHARPVPAFGPLRARLLIVGLAPGMHGANRTGRPFTGDYAGVLLYSTLHKLGFCNQRGSDDPKDGLRLRDCRITNAVKCVPPGNKPEGPEIRNCNRYLALEIAAVKPRAVLALGRIAHDAVLRAVGLRPADRRFAHGAVHGLPASMCGAQLFDSYHCSRYNTQTRRLTEAMFESVIAGAASFVRR